MSRVDDRIRQELQRSERSAPPDDLLSVIARRKGRVRVVRRVRIASLVVVLIVGVGLGSVGAVSLLRARGSATPGSDGGAVPRTAPATPICDGNTLSLDLDGNGRQDFVAEVGAPAPAPEVTCEGAASLGPYTLHVEVGEEPAEAFAVELPECEIDYACAAFDLPDLDRDGVPEIAVTIVEGGSAEEFTVYRIDPAAPDGLVRLRVAAPGDPWHTEYGLESGPVVLRWYGSTEHLHWTSCDEDPEQRLAVLTALRDPADPATYRVHGTLLELQADALTVEFSWDEEVAETDLVVPAEPAVCPSSV
jgi:hypothetical protein